MTSPSHLLHQGARSARRHDPSVVTTWLTQTGHGLPRSKVRPSTSRITSSVVRADRRDNRAGPRDRWRCSSPHASRHAHRGDRRPRAYEPDRAGALGRRRNPSGHAEHAAHQVDQSLMTINYGTRAHGQSRTTGSEVRIAAQGRRPRTWWASPIRPICSTRSPSVGIGITEEASPARFGATDRTARHSPVRTLLL